MFYVVLGLTAILFFSSQVLLCYKTKKFAIRCIPIFVILLGSAFCVATWFGLFGTSIVGVLPGHQLVAMIFGLVVVVAFLGMLAALLFLGSMKYREHVQD